MKPHPQNKQEMHCCGDDIPPHLERVEGQPVSLWRCHVCGILCVQVLPKMDVRKVDNSKAEIVDTSTPTDPLLQVYYRMMDGDAEE